jgi:hypothetical protein
MSFGADSGGRHPYTKGEATAASLHFSIYVDRRTVARVSAEEHMANYQAARTLLGKGKTGIKKSTVKKAKRKK